LLTGAAPEAMPPLSPIADGDGVTRIPREDDLPVSAAPQRQENVAMLWTIDRRPLRKSDKKPTGRKGAGLSYNPFQQKDYGMRGNNYLLE